MGDLSVSKGDQSTPGSSDKENHYKSTSNKTSFIAGNRKFSNSHKYHVDLLEIVPTILILYVCLVQRLSNLRVLYFKE